MARNFRRKHTAHPIADLNVTNLIDLGFMLLIIFMVATPLIQQEQKIPVNLPVRVGAAAAEARSQGSVRDDHRAGGRPAAARWPAVYDAAA